MSGRFLVMITYSEKLKDPRWQRKRLEVLSAADFKCEFCGAADRPLHVHHLKYTGEPWEAPMEDLESLCEGCHQNVTTDALFGINFDGVRATRIKAISDSFYAAKDRCANKEFMAAFEALFQHVETNGPKSALEALK